MQASGFASELLHGYESIFKIVDFPSDNELFNFLIGFKMIQRSI